jgi:hypothetical protein
MIISKVPLLATLSNRTAMLSLFYGPPRTLDRLIYPVAKEVSEQDTTLLSSTP